MDTFLNLIFIQNNTLAVKIQPYLRKWRLTGPVIFVENNDPKAFLFPSETPILTPSPTPSISVTPSISLTPSISVSETPSVTPSISVSNTPSSTPSISVSEIPSVTPSISISTTPSETPPVSVTPSITPSITPTQTPSETSTPSVTPSVTLSETPSLTPSITPSETLSSTPSISVSITPSVSVSNTPSITPSLSLTPTISTTPTISITPSISISRTPSVTPTITPTISVIPSISVTPSVTPSIGTDAIRAALTTSTASYDAAAVGNWVKVTAAEYANVQSTVTGIVTRGLTNAQASEFTGGWSGPCAHIQTSGSIQSPSGEYIIGFSARLSSSSGTVSVLTSTAYTGSYTTLANSPAINSANGREYWVRKAPTTANSSTTFVGSVTSTGTRVMTSTTFPTTYFDCSAPYSTWSLWSSGVPIFQFIGTSTKSW